MNQLEIMQYNEQRVLTTAQLAEAYGTDTKLVSKNFERNKERYTDGKHYYKLEGAELKAFKASRQNDENLKFAPVLYLWTEKGAWIHAKSLNTDQAWQAYEMLVDEYYRLYQRQPQTHLEILQASISQLVDQERRLAAVEARQEHITEVLSLNTTEWRKKVNSLINKMAKKLGGFEAYSDIRNESYQRLEERSKCKLYTRTTNIQKRMALEGVSKSKIDKVNALDAIAEDARLTEIYLAIVKEMSIHYKVELIPKTDMQATNLQEGDLMQTLEELPQILTAQHIATYLGISERRAYELMELKSFPLIRLGRSKRVNKEGFLRWLQDQEGANQVLS